MTRTRSGRLGGSLVVLVVVILAGLLYSSIRSTAQPTAPAFPNAIPTASATPGSTNPVAPKPSATRVHQALASLASAVVSSGRFVDGYQRTLFGNGWHDPDRNGCDARNDTLDRDLVDVAFRPHTNNCVVITGILHDPYTGKAIHFVRGNVTSEAVQIDHIVPVGWSWQHGAASWTAAKRESFYNDETNLLAVDGPTNGSKSDSGPADWLPPNRSYRCEYVIRFVTVVHRYALTIDRQDSASARRVLDGCSR